MRLTRKDLAFVMTTVLGERWTPKRIEDNEAQLGLKRARGVDMNRRVVRYDRTLLIIAFRRKGLRDVAKMLVRYNPSL